MLRQLLCLGALGAQISSCSLKLHEEVESEDESANSEDESANNSDDTPGEDSNLESCSIDNLPKRYKDLVPQNISPTQWIGDGTAKSCNEAALQKAFEKGGTWGFKCGANPHTIKLSKTLMVKKSITLEGNNLITLDGDNKNRVILGESHSKTILSNLKVVNGKASDKLGAGGIHTGWRGDLGISNVTFSNNTNTSSAERGGGAISTKESQVVILNSTFTDNSGQIGGAVNNLLGTLYVYNTTMRENTAKDSGGAIYVDGASHYGNKDSIEYSKKLPKKIEICGSKFLENSAGKAGGLFIYLYGNKKDKNDFNSFILEKSYFKGNKTTRKGSDGGGLWIHGKDNKHGIVKVRNSTFEGNEAQTYGGAVSQLGEFLTHYENITFWKNSANDGKADNVGEVNGQGGALFLSGDGIFRNVTIVNNNAKKAGGAIAGEGSYEFHNSIIAHNHVSFPWDKRKSNCSSENNSKPLSNNIQYLKDKDYPACGKNMIQKDPFPEGLPEKLEVVEGVVAPVLMLPSGSPALAAGKNCVETDALQNPVNSPCDLGAVQLGD